ncbi:hypothetical protein NKG05_18835 [Oerskovia sp. M15]
MLHLADEAAAGDLSRAISPRARRGRMRRPTVATPRVTGPTRCPPPSSRCCPSCGPPSPRGSPAELPFWLGELPLPTVDGELSPARECVLPGSWSAEHLDGLVPLDAQVTDSWGADVLRAAASRPT